MSLCTATTTAVPCESVSLEHQRQLHGIQIGDINPAVGLMENPYTPAHGTAVSSMLSFPSCAISLLKSGIPQKGNEHDPFTDGNDLYLVAW
ncbi:MAG: hypothetical protein IAF02_12360 [Anaerolineae bacterium]|nr:hypothetical protein [Anaerolineae bacterium]